MAPTIRIVIVEPVAARRERLRSALAREPEFSILGSGDDFLEACSLPVHRKEVVDVLLINIDEPGMPELDAWSAVRLILPGTRIVALTSGNDDRVLDLAFAAGVTALHRLDIEVSALGAIVRRAAGGTVDLDPELKQRVASRLLRPLTAAQIRVGGLTIDLHTQDVTRWGVSIQLTPLEFKVLGYLAQRPGRPVSSAELLEHVWRAVVNQGGTMAQVKNCIRRLRRKIEPNVKCPRYIQSLYSWGYVLRNPLEPPPD